VISTAQSGPSTPNQLTCIGEVGLEGDPFRSGKSLLLAAYPTGAEALGRVPPGCADVVLLNERLPDMRSLECLRRLKTRAPESRVFWVATARRQDTLLLCFMAGADGLLVKPVSLAHIFAREEARAAGFDARRLAKGRGVSLRSLERQFQKDIGGSPRNALNRWRLEEACRLLREGDSVKVVAGGLGFCDSTHFCRRFRKSYRVTPGGYAAACGSSPGPEQRSRVAFIL